MRPWTSLSFLVCAVGVTSCATSTDSTGGQSCGDAGVCGVGLVCKNGACVGYGNGGGGSGGGGIGGSGGGIGGSGGGIGGVGASGGVPSGGSGGSFGGSGGSFGGSGGSGGSGGGGICSTTIQGLPCADTWDTTQPCGACLATSCCAQTDACMNDATCAGLLECLAVECATAVDVDACVQSTCPGCATQDAITKFNAIGSCADTSCPVCASP